MDGLSINTGDELPVSADAWARAKQGTSTLLGTSDLTNVDSINDKSDVFRRPQPLGGDIDDDELDAADVGGWHDWGDGLEATKDASGPFVEARIALTRGI